MASDHPTGLVAARRLNFGAAFHRRVGYRSNTSGHVKESPARPPPIARDRSDVHQRAIGLDRGHVLIDSAARKDYASVRFSDIGSQAFDGIDLQVCNRRCPGGE